MHSFGKYKGYHIVEYDHNLYVRVFHHNATNYAFFSEDHETAIEQVYFINETDLFSVLGYVDDNFKIENTYNIMFYTPDDLPNDYFPFNQTSNPLNSNNATNISIDFRFNECVLDTSSNFTGLTLSDTNYTIIDGTANRIQHWSYAIGASTFWGRKNTIPGVPCHVNPIYIPCLLYTSPSPRDLSTSRMPSSA